MGIFEALEWRGKCSFWSTCYPSPVWSLTSKDALGCKECKVSRGAGKQFKAAVLDCSWGHCHSGISHRSPSPPPTGLPNCCSYSVCFICSPIGNYLAEIIVFLFCIFSSLWNLQQDDYLRSCLAFLSLASSFGCAARFAFLLFQTNVRGDFVFIHEFTCHQVHIYLDEHWQSVYTKQLYLSIADKQRMAHI